MKKRLFIAINLPAQARYELENDVEDLRPVLPPEIRFLPSEQWHITVLFLGYTPDEDVPHIIEALSETAKAVSAPAVKIDSISYGPFGRSPRMIWANTDDASSEILGRLKNVLEESLSKRGVNFDQEFRKFHGHITLARFPEKPLVLPENFGKKINYDFTADSLDLMESRLGRSRAVYELLQSMDFEIK
jgi:2'-5' RNA ligase